MATVTINVLVFQRARWDLPIESSAWDFPIGWDP